MASWLPSRLLGVLAASVIQVSVGVQQLSFDGLFQGGAVLQREVEVAVWGTAPDGDVTLSLDGKQVSTATVSPNGKWTAYLPAQATSWNRVLRAQHGDGQDGVETTVSFGAVLLCAGQSNMDMPLDGGSGFGAANGSVESAAAGRYTGKIWLASVQGKAGKAAWNGTGCSQYSKPDCVNHLLWNKVTPANIKKFSAVCWYAGKDLFERLGGNVPIGLIKGSIGGSPIEFWLPPGHVNNSVCGRDMPPCDDKKFTDSQFYGWYIEPFAPYTLGAVIWDQGERDVHCYAPATNTTARYPCMERELIKSWRQVFNSSFAFVAVQLPGYIGDCDAPGANPRSSYYNCVPGVFDMRLAQEQGTQGDSKAAFVVTYDLSCPFGVKTATCPFGSVHNIYKNQIGNRIGLELRRLMFQQSGLVTEGPHAVAATAKAAANGQGTEIDVKFDGGSQPFYMNQTQFCAACCLRGVGDFDASSDGGHTWHNATQVPKMSADTTATFHVPLQKVTHARYTANQAFPQCAVFNKEGLPALPFAMAVKASTTDIVV